MKARRIVAVVSVMCVLALFIYVTDYVRFKRRPKYLSEVFDNSLRFNNSVTILPDEKRMPLNQSFCASKKETNPKTDLQERTFGNTYTVFAEKKRVPFNPSLCPFKSQIIPKTDIQMLSVYKTLKLDDEDQKPWNIKYNTDQWKHENKLKIFIVPHSHNDPGWLNTFEKYYKSKTRGILSTLVKNLTNRKGKKFIWAEISFLSMWWNTHASKDEKTLFLKLIKDKRIEIVTGGWVMNDEATTHWVSTAIQLSTGHQWCIENLGIVPKNAWSIDPFGYSSSQPYLLKLAGFDNSIINRVHYEVKRKFAAAKLLEFRWRQLWDDVGKTDMFTHVFPFATYTVVHSCGPDPEICCLFDFTTDSCPTHKPPQNVTTRNIHQRAFLILDQWRKKAQLFRSNVLLIPLGEDFGYTNNDEWDKQFGNYDLLIDYFSKNKHFKTVVQYGNLEDYFNALHAEVRMTNFPVLSGDFFTYADKPRDYWSGYYTSRPFYKYMERVLLAYIRAAETLTSQAIMFSFLPNKASVNMKKRIEEVRRVLSLFQHHDAISGTSRALVVVDYAKKMLAAIKSSQSVIERATYYLLKQPPIINPPKENIYFKIDKVWFGYDELPNRISVTRNPASPSSKIVLYNSLPFIRHEILTVLVSWPYVEVMDPEGKRVMAEVTPVVTGGRSVTFASKFHLSFLVSVKSLALTTYTVVFKETAKNIWYTSYSCVRIYNDDPFSYVNLSNLFKVEQSTDRIKENITIQSRSGTRIVVNANGLIETMITAEGETVPLRMEFIKYKSQDGEKNSGGYLFVPRGRAKILVPKPFPKIIVTEGIFKTKLHTVLLSNEVIILLRITINNNPSLEHSEVEISNTILTNPQLNDLELAMRFSTDIENDDVFYTDANGMHMIKRRYMKKLGIQGNYYPVPTAAYIEDEHIRLTLLTSTPLGGAALKPGQIEIMQDRRLPYDDLRGLGEPVKDNVKCQHTFRLIIETANAACPDKTPVKYPGGQLSLGAHVSQQFLLQPIIVMHYRATDTIPNGGFAYANLNAADIVLAAYRTDVFAKNKDENVLHGIGLTFQRVYLEQCYGNEEVHKWYPLSDGQIQITEVVAAPTDSVYESTLTFVTIKDLLPHGVVTLCPYEIRSVFINHTLN